MREAPALAGDFVGAAAALVRRRTGLVFSAARLTTLENGLTQGMRRARCVEPEVYIARLDAEPGLLDDLVADITVGETYFFREPAQFEVIRDTVMPSLRSRAQSGQGLRVWSAGCASGEEPYSLAIVLAELGLAAAAHIVATDISRRALAAARRGVYTRWSLRGVPEPLSRSWFEASGDRFTLAPALRDAVEFRYLNLAEDAYPSLATGVWGMDLVLCRNVLIYFDAATVRRVAGGLLNALSDDGWLLLGASDPPLADLVPCEVVMVEAGLAYRRPGRRGARQVAAPRFETQIAPPSSPAVVPPAPAPVPVPRPVAPPAEPSLAQVIALVRELANRGDLQAAGTACATALDRYRASAELHYLHAVLLSEARLHRESAQAARRALYLDRGLAVAHLALGGALARLGDTAGAARALGAAEGLLAAMPPADIAPGSGGEPAGRLSEMARVQRGLLMGVAG